jgi:predicted NACHT family NTPase
VKEQLDIPMSNKTYNWKRFWCPREGRLNLSDNGYLWDPDAEFGSIYNPDVTPFESISKYPCLALLGEPGMGKSTAMQSEKHSIDSRVSECGDASLWVDLRSFQTDLRLVQSVFGDPAFQAWLTGKHRLHLFLDSLDECLLRVDTVAALLLDEFSKYPIDRLYLRIACRTADWPSSLEEGLQRLWGAETVKVYELAPLRRADVIEAAKNNELNADAFFSDLHKKDVIPLAIKPVTLAFLLNIYGRHGQFPSSQAELYLEGCQLLCEETSVNRRAAKRTGNLSAQQRLAVAARMAALTVFANRYTIWTSFDAGDVPVEDIEIPELCGGKEHIGEEEFAVTQATINEVLDTGLFSSRGANRMGWAHQTYAEFLAARYVVQRKMTVSQVMSIIAHPDDVDRKLVPQLHQTAAWLAGMLPKVFHEIIKTDPEVLLRSDIATADAKDRAALVEILLKQYDAETLHDRNIGGQIHYEKLAHPNLAEQLKPFIQNPAKGVIVRRVAIHIMEACKLGDLVPTLADLALNSSESLAVRVNAAYAVARIGDDATKTKLKPLATGDAGDDPDDELKGCGLKAVWPTSMAAKELFSLITAPKREDFVGAYHLFIAQDLPKSLAASHLPEALLWVAAQRPRHLMSYSLRKLTDVILTLGWDHVDFPAVLEAFARAALSRLKHDQSLIERRDHSLDADLRADFAKRRRLLECMVVILGSEQEEAIKLACSRPPILLSEDFSWMIERLHLSSDRTKQVWSRLIKWSLDQGDPRQVDAVLAACDAEPLLAKEFRWLIGPVELGSPEAEQLKNDYLESQRWARKLRNRPLLDPPPEKRIENLLYQYERGDYSAWWKLNLEMTLKPDSTHYQHNDELESDLTVLPGWESATNENKQRIVNAAKSYLLNQEPKTEEWVGENTIHRPAFAGYRAFRLLLHEDHEFIRNLSADVWKTWAPIILAYPIMGSVDEVKPRHELVRLAYSFAPDEITDILLTLIDKENASGGRISVIDKLQSCWDKHLAASLLPKVRDKTLKPENMGVLLEHLIDNEIQEAESSARSLISVPLPEPGDDRTRAVVAANVLMTHAKDAGWSVIWPSIQGDPAFGDELVSNVASRQGWGDGGGIWQKINEDELADLFLWLARRYPYAEDPQRNEDGRVTDRQSIGQWRDAILQSVKTKGTPQSCSAIRRISQEHPELRWLKWTLMEAQANARRHTWIPLNPSEILALATKQQARIVQNGDHLLDVVIDSLKRLEAKLQGEITIAQFLWEGSKDAPRPKDEASFCDFIKWQLEEDLRGRGIIINREVQIHLGERTDIYVNAVVVREEKDFYDSVNVIIEAKGCWHRNLNRAMETQLLGQYLKDNACRTGLYLVGWFNSELWDHSDDRKKHVPKSTLEEAQTKFDAQAVKLSDETKLIKALVINAALPDK